MNELQNIHWFLGIFIFWIGARTFYHMMKQGVMMRFWFFVVGATLIYYGTEKDNPIATAIFILLCFMEYYSPYYFYTRIFQQNIWNQWEDSSILPANLNYFIGMQFATAQNWKEAEQKFQISVQTDPNFAKALYWLGVSLGWQEKYNEATETFEKLVKVKPNCPVVYAGLALAKLQMGNIKGASDNYVYAIKLDPWCKQARDVGVRLISNLVRK